MRIYILTGALALVASTAGQAQDNDKTWIRKSFRSSCEWWETCKYRYHHRHVQIGRIYERDETWKHLDRCKPLVKAWGTQAQSQDNAIGHANLAFQGAVRFQYGEIYINLEHAEDIRYLCGPSSVGDTFTSKTLLPDYYRCEVQARPCRPRGKRE